MVIANSGTVNMRVQVLLWYVDVQFIWYAPWSYSVASGSWYICLVSFQVSVFPFFVSLFFFQDRLSLGSPEYPGTHSKDSEVHLPLPRECWD